jgi:hypothetical protein
MSAGRVVLLVFGILIVLVSIALLIGSAGVLAFDRSFRDSQGYYTTSFARVDANSYAVITQPADFHVNAGFMMKNLEPASIRIQAQNNLVGKPIFIGIATEQDAQNYIGSSSHDEFTGLSLRPYHLELRHFAGGTPPAAPVTQNFWIASATGTGTQTLNWNISSGTYSLVLMNADGSAPVDAQVSLAIRAPQVVRAVGWGLLIAGIVLIFLGGLMIFLAFRRTASAVRTP